MKQRSPLLHLALGTLVIIYAYITGVLNQELKYQESIIESEWQQTSQITPSTPCWQSWNPMPQNHDLIIKFKDGTPQSIISQLVSKFSINTLRNYSELPNFSFVSVTTSENLTLSEIIARYKADPNVEYVEPNFRYTIPDNEFAQAKASTNINKTKKSPLIPNDPYFESLWGLSNVGQKINDKPGGVVGADINVLDAWELSTGDDQMVIGVIDTGIDYTHPDINPNIWVNENEIPNNGIDDDNNGVIDDIHGYNAIDDSGDPMDDNDHGTHCAGTIGAAGDNGEGIVGVNWKVKLMGLKFLSSDGSGSLNDALEAINYVLEMKKRGVNIRILSNSWGGGGYSQALHDAIKTLNKEGILFVAAAGNSATNIDNDPHYPSSYQADNVLAVAAIDNQDNIARFSNYGVKSVHIGAPGVDIYSTIPGNEYAFFSGTSMATPHVSGVTSLMLVNNPSLTPKEIIDRIVSSSTKTTALAGKTISGGRINTHAAITGYSESKSTFRATITTR
ncbi:MAG: S8 family serine peptidase [Acidobacteria bacterium]|nr:S8 family serine peptidase [Acidobacteriota bacterium]